MNLHGSLPRTEIPPHKEIVETGDTNKLEEFGDGLLDYALLDVEGLETLPHLVEEVENIVHAESWCCATSDEAIEQTTSSIRSDETRKRLRFDEGRYDHLVEALLRLLHPCVVDVVLETVQIVLDNSDEALVIVPIVVTSNSFSPGTNPLQDVAFGDTDEGKNFMDVG